jgi:hypothetical protein
MSMRSRSRLTWGFVSLACVATLLAALSYMFVSFGAAPADAPKEVFAPLPS